MSAGFPARRKLSRRCVINFLDEILRLLLQLYLLLLRTTHWIYGGRKWQIETDEKNYGEQISDEKVVDIEGNEKRGLLLIEGVNLEANDHEDLKKEVGREESNEEKTEAECEWELEGKYEDNQEETKGFAEEAAKVDVKVGKFYEKELKHA